MPAYNAKIPVPSAERGNPLPMWSAETPTPGTGGASASQQYGIVQRVNVSGTPFSVQGQFSGAPGVFEVDVQGAQTDADASYVNVGTPITAVDGNNGFRLDVNATTRFVRLLMKTRTNSVSVTANIVAG